MHHRLLLGRRWRTWCCRKQHLGGIHQHYTTNRISQIDICHPKAASLRWLASTTLKGEGFEGDRVDTSTTTLAVGKPLGPIEGTTSPSGVVAGKALPERLGATKAANAVGADDAGTREVEAPSFATWVASFMDLCGTYTLTRQ